MRLSSICCVNRASSKMKTCFINGVARHFHNTNKNDYVVDLRHLNVITDTAILTSISGFATNDADKDVNLNVK